MRICVISKDDVRGGGASVAAGQLADFFRRAGHHAEHLNAGDEGLGNPYADRRTLIRWLKNKESRKGLKDYSTFELLSKKIRSLPQDFDVIHLHDMSTVFSPGIINWLSHRVLTVWTMHDCSPFTAGCLYPGSCRAYQSNCGNCPQHRSWPLSSSHDRTPELHARRKTLKTSKVHFTAPSRWMMGMYEGAGWPVERSHYIPNGVNLDVFKPQIRSDLRRKHGLPEDGLLFLFSAGWLHDDRKGPRDAVEFIQALSPLAPTLILVGRYSDEASLIFSGIECRHFGFVKSEEERAEIYAMCDATLLFSKDENAPLIALESLASGSPIFGFNSGGIAEIVGGNGFVSSNRDVAEVAAKASFMSSPDWRSDLSALCRTRAEEAYDYKKVANEYINLFRKLLERR